VLTKNKPQKMILRTIYFSPDGVETAEAPAMSQHTQEWARKMADGLPVRETPPTAAAVEQVAPIINNNISPEGAPTSGVETAPAAVSSGDSPTYTEDENKAWLESFMSDKPASTTTPVVENSVSTPLEAGKNTQPEVTAPDARFSEYEQKAKEYERLIQSDTFKAIDEFIRSGKSDPIEFLSEQIGADPSKLAPVQIKEISLRELGLTAEEIAEELEEFKELSPAKQKVQTAPILDNLKIKRNEKLKAFSTSYKPQEQIDHAEHQRRESVLKATFDALNDKVENQLKGKKYDELLISPDMAEKIKGEVINNSYPIYKDNKLIGYDLDKAINAAVVNLYGKEWKKANIDRAILAGYDSVIRERNNPSKEGRATGGVIPTQSESQKLADATDKAYPILKRR
jgi:hypothetical protein